MSEVRAQRSGVRIFCLLWSTFCLLVSFLEAKTITAKRTEEKIIIDGRLNESAWKAAIPSGDFTQIYPKEDTVPTESTTVWVLYDSSALYVGVMAYDSEPDKIVSRVGRRDNMPYSDHISIYIDSFRDKKSYFSFSVNPRRVKADGYHDELAWDSSFDPVWDVGTSIDTFGWVAEFEIPWSSLRFPKRDETVFGFQVSRRIARKKESDQWIYIPRHASDFVRHFGELTGIKGISPKSCVDLLPYGVGSATCQEEVGAYCNTPLYFNTGVDFKYIPTPNIVFDGCINPDFGQVEADPSVLNLTSFETYYEEKRPFFIERKHFFKTQYELFYSRRIGHPPSYFSVLSVDEEIDRPTTTTILGAVKLTGKTGKGTTFGIIDAVTAPEYAVVDSVGEIRKRLIEPFSNYGVFRVSQDVDRSRVGILFTSVNRKEAENAYTGGVDWDFKFLEDYAFDGQLAVSSTAQSYGDARQFSIGKEGGKYLYANMTYFSISPSFDINDIGYLYRNDVSGFKFYLNPYYDKEWWVTRNVFVSLGHEKEWNTGGLLLSNSVHCVPNITFLNYWSIYGALGHTFEHYSDRETRGGPPTLCLPSNWVFIRLSTDSRKSIIVAPFFNYWVNMSGSLGESFSLTLTLKPLTNLGLSLIPSYTKSVNDAQWITNIDDGGDGVYDHFVFGKLREDQLNASLRIDFALTPELTFELWTQPFVAVGDYSDFKELAEPKTHNFKPYELGWDPDFNMKTFKLNFVARWEYRPGSTLYVVYSPSLSDYSNAGDFSAWRDFSGTFTGEGPHTFLIKANYRFML